MRLYHAPRPPATSDQVDFLLADASLGKTFALLAAQAAHGSATRVRHLANARAALADVQHHCSRVSLPREDASALHSLLRELAALVRALHHH